MALLLRQVIDSGAPPSLARLPMTPRRSPPATTTSKGPMQMTARPQRGHGRRTPRVTTPIVSTAMAIPSACQQQNREYAAWWKPLLWPGAWVPIATAGDRAWMLRTGQGALPILRDNESSGSRVVEPRIYPRSASSMLHEACGGDPLRATIGAQYRRQLLGRRTDGAMRVGYPAWVAGLTGSSSGCPWSSRACSAWVAGHGETPSSSRSSWRSWS